MSIVRPTDFSEESLRGWLNEVYKELLKTTGSWVLLDTQTASSSATLDFTTGIDSTYDLYVFVLTSIIPQTDNTQLFLRVSEDGGANWQADAADYGWTNTFASGATTGTENDASDSEIQVVSGMGTGTGESFNARIWMHNPSGSTYKQFGIELETYTATPAVATAKGVGVYLSVNVINGVRFVCSSGNVASGTVRLYGIRD